MPSYMHLFSKVFGLMQYLTRVDLYIAIDG